MSNAFKAIRFLTDEDFREAIVDGLRCRVTGIDMLTAPEAGTLGFGDPDVLAFAAQRERILLTHDTHTMPDHFAAFLMRGQHSPGVFMIPQLLPIGRAIDAVVLVWAASAPDEWRDQCLRLPL
jgi:uncharacterized protein DUF5615